MLGEVETANGVAFEVDGSFRSGRRLAEIKNESAQPHFPLLSGSPVPPTMDQVM